MDWHGISRRIISDLSAEGKAQGLERAIKKAVDASTKELRQEMGLGYDIQRHLNMQMAGLKEALSQSTQRISDLSGEVERLRDAIECGALPSLVRYALNDGLTIEQVRETAVFKMCTQALEKGSK